MAEPEQLEFYEAWKVADEEQQNKKKQKKSKKRRRRQSTPRSRTRTRSPEVATDPYLLECLGEFY